MDGGKFSRKLPLSRWSRSILEEIVPFNFSRSNFTSVIVNSIWENSGGELFMLTLAFMIPYCSPKSHLSLRTLAVTLNPSLVCPANVLCTSKTSGSCPLEKCFSREEQWPSIHKIACRHFQRHCKYCNEGTQKRSCYADNFSIFTLLGLLSLIKAGRVPGLLPARIFVIIKAEKERT